MIATATHLAADAHEPHLETIAPTTHLETVATTTHLETVATATHLETIASTLRSPQIVLQRLNMRIIIIITLEITVGILS